MATTSTSTTTSTVTSLHQALCTRSNNSTSTTTTTTMISPPQHEQDKQKSIYLPHMDHHQQQQQQQQQQTLQSKDSTATTTDDSSSSANTASNRQQQQQPQRRNKSVTFSLPPSLNKTITPPWQLPPPPRSRSLPPRYTSDDSLDLSLLWGNNSNTNLNNNKDNAEEDAAMSWLIGSSASFTIDPNNFKKTGTRKGKRNSHNHKLKQTQNKKQQQQKQTDTESTLLLEDEDLYGSNSSFGSITSRDETPRNSPQQKTRNNKNNISSTFNTSVSSDIRWDSWQEELKQEALLQLSDSSIQFENRVLANCVDDNDETNNGNGDGDQDGKANTLPQHQQDDQDEDERDITLPRQHPDTGIDNGEGLHQQHSPARLSASQSKLWFQSSRQQTNLLLPKAISPLKEDNAQESNLEDSLNLEQVLQQQQQQQQPKQSPKQMLFCCVEPLLPNQEHDQSLQSQQPEEVDEEASFSILALTSNNMHCNNDKVSSHDEATSTTTTTTTLAMDQQNSSLHLSTLFPSACAFS